VKHAEQIMYVPIFQLRSIHIHPATKLSYEVIITAIEHNIDVLFVDRKGFPIGRVWSNKFGSISTIRKNQLEFSQSKDALVWITNLLAKKSDGQMAVLELLGMLKNVSVEDSIKQITKYQHKILQMAQQEDLSETFASLRGFEGSMGRVYFEQISSILPDEYKFKKRSKHPSLDGFNCLLNYTYGILYGHCESALIQAGLDPFIGVMHRDEYNRPVLVYDFIEPFRHWADYVVCHLCLQEVVSEDFFEVELGVFWLGHIGKRILIQSFNDYLSEKITIEGLSRTRLTHLELEAQRLAAFMKKY
jgi:CRISPR-associated protein Cas1